VAKTGRGEFTILAPGISLNSAQAFAKRLSGALLRTKIMHDDHAVTVTLSIGVSSVVTDAVAHPEHVRQIAKRRSEVASMHGGNQIIGMEEEDRLNRIVAQAMQEQEANLKVNLTDLHSAAATLTPITPSEMYVPDVTTALKWLSLGRDKEVLPHLKTLYHDIQPLLTFLQQHRALLA
jgi:hypothetical protein